MFGLRRRQAVKLMPSYISVFVTPIRGVEDIPSSVFLDAYVLGFISAFCRSATNNEYGASAGSQKTIRVLIDVYERMFGLVQVRHLRHSGRRQVR